MTSVHSYSADELVEALPRFLDSLYEIEEYDVAIARKFATKHGLVHSPKRAGRDTRRDLRLLHSGEDPTALNRRLRIAVNKTIGKPTGTAAEYSQGPFRFTMDVEDEAVNISFIYAQHRLDEVAEAARAWLAGECLDAWKNGVGYRFVSSPADEQGLRSADVRNLGVHIHATDSGGSDADVDGIYISISLPIHSGAHPRGIIASTAEERYEVVSHFLIDVLGEQEGSRFTGRYWRNGRRWAQLKRSGNSGNLKLQLTHGSETLLVPKQGLRCDRCGEAWAGYEGDPCPRCAAGSADSAEPPRYRPRSRLLRLFNRGTAEEHA
jgi:hypothetical protein